jgi:tetratricopeptide (TPR) repeat protein
MLRSAARQVDQELSGQPAAQAGVYHTIARMYAGLWMWQDAEPPLRLALKRYLDLYGDRHPEVARCLTLLGRSLTIQRRQESIPVQERALNIRRQLYGEEHPLVAEAYGNLGFAIWHAGLPRHAEIADWNYKRSLEIYRRVAGEPIDDWARTTYSYAAFCCAHDRHEEGNDLFAKAAAMYRAMSGSGDVYMNNCLEDYSVCLQHVGRFDEAAAVMQESIALRPSGFADDDIARLRWRLGGIHRRQGNMESELREYDHSLAMSCETLADLQPEDSARLLALAGALRAGDEAAPYRDVFDELEARTPEIVGDLIDRAIDVATALRRLDRRNDADMVLEQAMVMTRSLQDQHHLEVAAAHDRIGRRLQQLARFEQAEIQLRAAHTVLRDHRGDHCPYTVAAAQQLARLYTAWGRPVEAARYRDLAAPPARGPAMDG